MTHPYTEGYFERAEGSNYRNYGDDPGWSIIVRELQWYCDPQVIYELASAKGWFLHHARAAGIDAEGCDLSEYAVSCVPADTQPYLVCHDATQGLPWEDETADLVCSFEFLEHVREMDLPAVFAAMDRVLAPGGLSVHRIGIAGIPVQLGTEPDCDTTHVTAGARAWWEQWFCYLGYVWDSRLEDRLDDAFAGRDWVGRHFAWRKPR